MFESCAPFPSLNPTPKNVIIITFMHLLLLETNFQAVDCFYDATEESECIQCAKMASKDCPSVSFMCW